MDIGNICVIYIPRMASNLATKALICASPEYLNVEDWFDPICNVNFGSCRVFRYSPDSELCMYLEKH